MRVIPFVLSLSGLIAGVYLILNGYKINSAVDFFSMPLWALIIALWILFPRIVPIIWLFSVSAGVSEWIIYIFFGIIVPRTTFGYIIFQFFPPSNRFLGLGMMIIGLILDIIENKNLQKNYEGDEN